MGRPGYRPAYPARRSKVRGVEGLSQREGMPLTSCRDWGQLNPPNLCVQANPRTPGSTTALFNFFDEYFPCFYNFQHRYSILYIMLQDAVIWLCWSGLDSLIDYLKYITYNSLNIFPVERGVGGRYTPMLLGAVVNTIASVASIIVNKRVLACSMRIKVYGFLRICVIYLGFHVQKYGREGKSRFPFYI